MNTDTSKSDGSDLFKEIFDNTLDAILVTDNNGNCTEVNKSACDLTGYSKEELLNMNILDLTPADNKEAGKNIWNDFISGDKLEGEYEILNKNKMRIFTDFKAVANIQPGKHISVLRDITNKKNREQTLKLIEERYKDVQRIAQMGDFEWDLKNNELLWSDEVFNILGLEKQTPTFELLEKFIHPADHKFWSESVQKSIEAKSPLVIDFRIIKPNDDTVWIHNDTKFIFDENSAPVKLVGSVEDITERKNTELELARSNEFLDRVGEIAKVGGWEVNPEKGTVYWSKTTKMIHEVPLDYEPTLEEATNYFPGESGEKITAAVSRAIEKGEDYSLELEFVTAKNNKLWIHTKGRSLFKDGKCVRLYGVFQDITLRKKAEEERRVSDERFRIAQDMSPDGFTILKPVRDSDDRVIDFIWVYENEAVAKMNGTDPQKVIGKQLLELFPGHKGTQLMKYYQQVAESGEALTFEEGYSGETIKNQIWFRLVVVPMDENIAVLSQDITETRKAEQALKESEKRLSSLYNSMIEGVAIHDVIFNDLGEIKNYRIIDVNARFVEVLGIKRKDIIGKLATDAYNVDPPPFIETYSEVVKSKRSKRFETYFPPMKKHFSIGVFTISENQFATVFEDITDRKNAEKELQKHRDHLERLVEERTRSLQAANKELEEFVYSVSHDLRSPLRSILGFSEIIGRRHKGLLNEEGQKYFDNIVQASHNMNDLIDDLLQYSRIGIKTLEELKLRDVLKKTINELHDDLVKRNAEFVLPETNPEIFSNKTLLHQIFLNIINNATIYQEKGNKPKIEIKFEEDDENIIIAIKDNGIGIEKAYQEKIFNIFQRLHSNDEFTGTGIGLAIVKKTVNILNGKVWLKSEPGKGSTFFVLLPKSKENEYE